MVTVVLIGGLTNAVEKAAKFIMPVLVALLLICGVWALFISPNALEGLKYYLVPDFSKLSIKTFSDACVQVMFSIGTGWCLYVTLGAKLS